MKVKGRTSPDEDDFGQDGRRHWLPWLGKAVHRSDIC